MAVKYTPDQQNAIDSRGCHLIVSAAAGSGKTAVQVERVIQLICDSQSPCDIDELLVVTFTNAAAAEMREKIGAALLKRVASDKTGRLRRQLSLLGGAKIETVHAFCLDLIKENYALCGLPADFSVADTDLVAIINETISNARSSSHHLTGKGITFSAGGNQVTKEYVYLLDIRGHR